MEVPPPGWRDSSRGGRVTCSVAGEVISEWTPEVVMVLENGTCGGGRVGDALVKVLVGVWGSSISGE